MDDEYCWFGSFEEPHLLVCFLLRQTCLGVMGKAVISLLWFVLSGNAELSLQCKVYRKIYFGS